MSRFTTRSKTYVPQVGPQWIACQNCQRETSACRRGSLGQKPALGPLAGQVLEDRVRLPEDEPAVLEHGHLLVSG